jgi:hypothetical protein
MFRHFWLPLAVALGVLLAALAPARAAEQRVFYTGLRSCYRTGSAIPNFTLSAEVTTSDDYRITHTVAQSGAPGVPETVYEGPIAAGTSRSVTITGGNATVPGSYTITGRLYLVSSGLLLAQAQSSVLIADPCPTPTPQPSSAPTPSNTPRLPADVLWSQNALPSRGVRSGALLMVNLRAYNAGRGSGGSDAILFYDPRAITLLDAQPRRDGDWIRAHDDRQGRLVISVGELRPRDSAIVPLRFLATGALPTTELRLARDDGKDIGNPLFVTIGGWNDEPLPLRAERTGATITLHGRGFKPGEPLSAWGNRPDGSTIALGGGYARDDRDGTIALELSAPAESISSIVVQGRISAAIGRLDLQRADSSTRSVLR